MSASKFAIFCIVLVFLASCHESTIHTVGKPKRYVRRFVGSAVHTVGKPKRYVRRFVGSAVKFF
ncbi:hypothetical protein YC2023_109652 [Brassica napus]